VTRPKFSERRMEGRTGVMCMYSNELRVGVKSLSNSAMAGSCRNMPQYSLAQLGGGVKYGYGPQGRKITGLFPTLNLSST
jgi:hypothetical protein